MLYAGYNLAATLASIPGGQVATGGAMCLCSPSASPPSWLPTLVSASSATIVVGLALLFAAAGVGTGLVETAEHAAVASVAPNEIRGSAFGLLAATQSFGNLAASAIAGALWTLASPRLAFLYLAA